VGPPAFVILEGKASVESSGTRVGTLGPGTVVGETGDHAVYPTPHDATTDGGSPTSKPSESNQPNLTEHAPARNRLRRGLIICGLSALLIVLTWWLVPVLGFILTMLALLAVHGIVAPEPIDTYLDGHFDRHCHSRW
jgi:hypothetical protein